MWSPTGQWYSQRPGLSLVHRTVRVVAGPRIAVIDFTAVPAAWKRVAVGGEVPLVPEPGDERDRIEHWLQR